MKCILTTADLLLVTSNALVEPMLECRAGSSRRFPAQQVADLSQGRGMGVALPAELNGGIPACRMCSNWRTSWN